MVVTLFGIVIFFKLQQPPNAWLPIYVTLFGIVIFFKLKQSPNAWLPIYITLFGIVIFFNPVHLLNAPSIICVTPLLMITSSIPARSPSYSNISSHILSRIVSVILFSTDGFVCCSSVSCFFDVVCCSTVSCLFAVSCFFDVVCCSTVSCLFAVVCCSTVSFPIESLSVICPTVSSSSISSPLVSTISLVFFVPSLSFFVPSFFEQEHNTIHTIKIQQDKYAYFFIVLPSFPYIKKVVIFLQLLFNITNYPRTTSLNVYATIAGVPFNFMYLATVEPLLFIFLPTAA